jgi:DNA-binding MarR family transcriptional regulator
MTQNLNELFFLIKHSGLQITQLFEQYMHISLTRHEMLLLLQDVEVVTQSYLQEKMTINQAAITRHLKILEEAHYITRNRNPENNREMLVSLTATGRSLLSHCAHSKDDLISQLFGDFTDEQLQTTMQVLAGLNKNSQQLITTLENGKD